MPAIATRGAAIDIRYRITGHEGTIDPAHPLWPSPLPGITRHTTPQASAHDMAPAGVTHAAYFTAVHAYLTGPGRGHLEQALARRFSAKAPSHPLRVDVALEKHGEFYHPARIDIPVGRERISLVLNVAVTTAGSECVASELVALERVSQRLPAGTVPWVYGQAGIPGPSQTQMTMFLADWFAGFHEFHLSVDPRDGCQGMVVWDTDTRPFYLSERQQAEVYRQVAYLLTRAYDPATSEQIYPWHHASGDFIVRVRNGSVALRLITARQYAPTLAGYADDLDEEARLMALLVFFLNLTLRNRIDRLDGTGAAAWAGEVAVPATVTGFFEGLDSDLRSVFKAFLASYRFPELVEVLSHVADQYRLMPMEIPLLETHLGAHGEQLYAVFPEALPGD